MFAANGRDERGTPATGAPSGSYPAVLWPRRVGGGRGIIGRVLAIVDGQPYLLEKLFWHIMRNKASRDLLLRREASTLMRTAMIAMSNQQFDERETFAA